MSHKNNKTMESLDRYVAFLMHLREQIMSEYLNLLKLASSSLVTTLRGNWAGRQTKKWDYYAKEPERISLYGLMV